MLKHQLRVAIRSLIRHRGYTALNIIGLGLGVSIVVGLFWILRFESGFDRFQPDAPRTFQIRSYNAFGQVDSWVPPGMIRAIKDQVTGVERVAPVYRWDADVIQALGQNLRQKAYFVSPDFLSMVKLQWVEGSPQASLSSPNQVVLDEPTARRIFANQSPLGKTIRFENQIDLTVTGIVKQTPINSEFQLQMMVSYSTLHTFIPYVVDDSYWAGGDSFDHAYVVLKPGVNKEAVERQLTNLALQHKDKSDLVRYDLNPLDQVHFDTSTDDFNYSTPRWLLYALGTIGLFLILIASINFVNMATVQAVQRSKEIGMRKILGSGRRQVMMQFFLETALIVLAGVALGAFLANLGMPYAGGLLNTQASLNPYWNGDTLVFLAALFVLITFLSGMYPALVLSGFRPMQMLQQRLYAPGAKGANLRKGLVITQFAIAQVLVVCTLMGGRQINYLYHTDPGFLRARVVRTAMPDRENALFRARLRQELLSEPGIEGVTFGLTCPSSVESRWFRTVSYPSLPKGSETFRMQYVDTDYLAFFGIQMLAGRPFTSGDTLDQVIINEKGARDMGFQRVSDAVGARIKVNTIDTVCTVVGVVRDFHSQSLKMGIEPHVIMYDPSLFQTMAMRIRPGQDASALRHLAAAWKGVFPNNYFAYSYLSDNLSSYYKDETKLGRLLSLFAVIGILIGCMGLFGLVAFVSAQKTKEIGIRKVLGAGLAQILALLTKDFVQLVGWAFVIAVPLGWYLMHLFLQGYAYKAAMDPWVFILTGIATLGIALVTVSGHAIKAAIARPVKSLRSE